MRILRTVQILSAASAVLLLSGCWGSSPERAMEQQLEEATGGDANVDMNADGSMHVETTEGTYDTGNNKLPDDWPEDAPIFAGATVQFSGSANPSSGKPGAAAVLMTTRSAADVLAFYKTELATQGWTISSTMDAQGTTIMGATKGTRALSLMIGTAAEGQTSITIGVGEQ